MSDLGRHPGLGDHHDPAAARHFCVHEHHVRALGQSEVDKLQAVDRLSHGFGLPRQRRFGNLKAHRFEQATISRNRVSGVEGHDVARDEFGVGHLAFDPIPQNDRAHGSRGPKRVETVLGASLLDEVEGRIERDDKKDDNRGLPLARDRGAHCRGHHEHNRHSVGQQFRHAAERRLGFRLVERIRPGSTPNFRCAGLGVSRNRVDPERFEGLLRIHGVPRRGRFAHAARRSRLRHMIANLADQCRY